MFLIQIQRNLLYFSETACPSLVGPEHNNCQLVCLGLYIIGKKINKKAPYQLFL
jgi:hypothetical protein